MTRDEVRADVISSRPPGWFDDVRGLVDAYAGLMIELRSLWARLNRERPGTPASTALTVAIGGKCELAHELFDALHLGPQGAGLPPPRLQ